MLKSQDAQEMRSPESDLGLFDGNSSTELLLEAAGLTTVGRGYRHHLDDEPSLMFPRPQLPAWASRLQLFANQHGGCPHEQCIAGADLTALPPPGERRVSVPM
jgi:hypothetical protein